MTYKRLIEVDLPIRTISSHARREKSIRHGHLSTLHIWWARRPLASCRAVILASLLPDPADNECPPDFRETSQKLLTEFAEAVTSSSALAQVMGEAAGKWIVARNQLLKHKAPWTDPLRLRKGLLEFIGDACAWEISSEPAMLTCARGLVRAAYPEQTPLVVDPFAGGGSIPLEALRVGADAFGSDLNPVAVLLNKVVLEYIPKYGQQLADEVRKWGLWIKNEAEKELADFYPHDPDGSTPIAYLWARTIRCEGPACGAEVPMIRSLWLAKKAERSLALRLMPDRERRLIDIDVMFDARAKDVGEGTAKRGSVTCPVCGYTTSLTRVKAQLQAKHGGTNDARMIAVRRDNPATGERTFRTPSGRDIDAVTRAQAKLGQELAHNQDPLSFVPDETTAHYHSFVNRGPIYGMLSWMDYFTPRQALCLGTFARLVRELPTVADSDSELSTATQTILALVVDRLADFNSSLCVLNSTGGRGVVHTFGRQALPMVWDFIETNPFNDVGANWLAGIEAFAQYIPSTPPSSDVSSSAHAEQASATRLPLPDDAASIVATDPPYYYSVQYADLSDFFYVWLRRTLPVQHAGLFRGPASPKSEEIIVQSPGHQEAVEGKNRVFYEEQMELALEEARRVLEPSGVGVVVFAHSSTSGWEAMLQALVKAGWVITASWPIDTERQARLLALDRSVLASSIHLVCRPRLKSDNQPRIGEWRDVLSALPQRTRDWMLRLAEEGVAGADALFACLGPALEIFSQYERVETAGGKVIPLREYLEQVWAAVGREALNQIFSGADPTGFEEDGRLTALWLWTLTGGKAADMAETDEEDSYELEELGPTKPIALKGFALEYDTARKLAQGIGAHLEDLDRPGGVVAIKGDTARLLAVKERRPGLFGSPSIDEEDNLRKKKQSGKQLAFGEIEAQVGSVAPAVDAPGGATFSAGKTTLDRIHQAMLLFGEGRGEALKRFLVEDGAGRDDRFWRLAQTLSALYPASSHEKRWVDGVLARKKGMGL